MLGHIDLSSLKVAEGGNSAQQVAHLCRFREGPLYTSVMQLRGTPGGDIPQTPAAAFHRRAAGRPGFGAWAFPARRGFLRRKHLSAVLDM